MGITAYVHKITNYRNYPAYTTNPKKSPTLKIEVKKLRLGFKGRKLKRKKTALEINDVG
jgi:hypothetical protein